ncbi:TPA: hypothetical protein EYP44_03785 [Candidatus Bathyarchaeota archaeon]|nr:hypothetical protein [Candidatus Bathyarchaeota archaeon]
MSISTEALDQLARSNKSADDIVEKLGNVLNEVVARLKPRIMIVAGSLARGTFVRRMSDIDVLAVLGRKPGLYERFTLRAVEDHDVEITALSVEDVKEALQRGNQFVRDALLHGILVYGRRRDLEDLITSR